MFRLLTPALLLVAATVVTPVADITGNPSAYDGARVTIVGTAGTQRVGSGGESVYDLDDGGHRITVVSRGPAPALGAHLQVEGAVAVHQPGNSEIRWPPVVVEATRITTP